MNKRNPVLGTDDCFFTYKELVDLGIGSRSTIERIVKAGQLKKHKFNRNVRFLGRDVREFCERSAVVGGKA